MSLRHTASAVCMDKAVTHTLLSAANIEQAHYLWFYADRYFADGEKIRNKIAARLNFPVFVSRQMQAPPSVSAR